jgi:transposase
LAAFASGISTDDAAVRAETRELRLNGQVEGQIAELKLVKRPMCGKRQIRFAPSETGRQDANPGGPKLRQTL